MNRARSQRHEFATLVAALVAVYAALILVWLWFFGHHWAQAFPKPRTMLALSLVAIPSWSVIMALRQLAKLRRASRLDQMLPRGRSRERERRNGSARTLATGNSQQERRTLILFSTIAVIGLVVIGAYGDYSNAYHRNLLVDSLQPGRSGIHWTSKGTHKPAERLTHA
ncbi:hypothetical protein BKA62DRAFT_112067 [Auriculariales sp. MPI-PUGE-AT-0066]|nr:hypothetical protein BKA62DRAFT_112067 [Auriculariales sp. MPI-PUGE-AT-0066]